VDPWRDNDDPDGGGPIKRPSSWGCAVAAIIGAVAVIVAVVIALIIANGVAGDLLKDLV
jgi:hypothetical protein